MINCELTWRINSKITPTMIIIPAPEISRGTVPIESFEKKIWISIGETAINARNSPPNKFSLLDI